MTALSAEGDMKGPGDLWFGLGDQEQVDVLRALGAQCRVAVNGARAAGCELDIDAVQPRFAEIYPHATRVFRAIVAGEQWAVPELPACACCRLVTAGLLCGLAVRAGRHSGLSEELIAHHCRQAADRVAVI